MKAIIPVRQMDPVLISNGFEKAFPYHLTSDFSIIAEHDGKVLSYDEATGLLAIQYTWKEGKEIKTKNVVNMLKALKVEGKTLIVLKDIDEKVILSAQNIANVVVTSVTNVSVYDLMYFDHVVMDKDSVKLVEEALL